MPHPTPTPTPPPPLTDPRDLSLVAALRAGLPLCPRPYATLGADLGMSEAEVLRRLRDLREADVMRRFGAIVRHHEVGYAANAMVVIAPPTNQVAALGRRLAQERAVTLCYQRRPAPDWPYTLYCMVHGRSRAVVLAQINAILRNHGLKELPHRVLFSRRRFKQTAGQYGRPARETASLPTAVGDAS